MTQLTPPNAIDVEALLWRQGGIWKIAIRLPQWLFEDIEENGQPVTILLRDGTPIASSARWDAYEDYLLSNAKFEFISGKTEKQE